MRLRAFLCFVERRGMEPFPLKLSQPQPGTRSAAFGCLPGVFALLGMWTACVSQAWAFGDHVPDWVKTAAAQTLPKMPQTAKAVLLLEETTYTVGSDGRAVEHVREVMKILRPQGRDLARPSVYADKDTKVLSMHVWSIDPSGHEYQVKDSEMLDFSPPSEGILYSDEKFRIADPPGRDPGGIIAMEYEVRERPYLAETNWSFQGELPRISQSFTLVLPEGFNYSTTWAHHSKVSGADLENRHTRWEMNNEPGIDLENTPMAPATASLSGRMTVHYAGPGLQQPQEGSWKGVGQWYDGLMRDRVASTPEIAAKATELTAGKNDFYDRASAIGEFVQRDIRYFGEEIGIGGSQPHFAGDIFRGHYGDCKDKATLLSAMLSSAGIHGTLVLVDTRRGVVDPNDPSMEGNHAIAAIEIPKGYESAKLHSVIQAENGKRYLIFDPTWEHTPFGQLEDNLQGGFGLLVEGAASQIFQFPVLAPELNRVSRSASFQLSADGTLSGNVVEKRFGGLAEHRRMLFGGEDAKKQQEDVDRIVARDFSSVSVTGLKVENLQALNKDLTLSFDLQAAHFSTSTGPLLMVRPRVLGSFALDVDRKARMVPIDLQKSMSGSDEYEITLPPGYVVDELPDPVQLDLGFAKYQSSTEFREGKLHYKRTYTQREVSLPAEKYPELQKLAAVIAGDEESRAVLKRAPVQARDVVTDKVPNK